MDSVIGQIRSIRDDKDYAFIVHGVNRDIFLHRTQYLGNWDELREKYRIGTVNIQFEIQEGPKGLRAIKAQLYGGE